MPNGEWSCFEHATADEIELVGDYDEWSKDVGIKPGDDPRWGHARLWPYGPNIDVAMRGRMLEWAEARELRLNPRKRCIEWLQGGRCPHVDGHGIGGWRDHSTAWTREGQPAALVSHPYQIAADDIAELLAIAALDEISVDVSESGWYGHGTRQITITPTDRRCELPASHPVRAQIELQAIRERVQEEAA